MPPSLFSSVCVPVLVSVPVPAVVMWSRCWVFPELTLACLFPPALTHAPTLPLRPCSFQGATPNANSRRYAKSETVACRAEDLAWTGCGAFLACVWGKCPVFESLLRRSPFHVATNPQVELLTWGLSGPVRCVLRAFISACASPPLHRQRPRSAQLACGAVAACGGLHGGLARPPRSVLLLGPDSAFSRCCFWGRTRFPECSLFEGQPKSSLRACWEHC